MMFSEPGKAILSLCYGRINNHCLVICSEKNQEVYHKQTCLKNDYQHFQLLVCFKIHLKDDNLL